MDVAWVDYRGRRVHRRTLAAGESYTEQTFATHPWLVRVRKASEPVDFSSDGGGGGDVLALRVGRRAVGSLVCHSVIWQPADGSLSVMARSRVGGGPPNKRYSAAGGAREAAAMLARGEAPTLTVMLLGGTQEAASSVFQQAAEADADDDEDDAAGEPGRAAELESLGTGDEHP